VFCLWFTWISNKQTRFIRLVFYFLRPTNYRWVLRLFYFTFCWLNKHCKNNTSFVPFYL
jgi:hypothetical protein